MKAKLVTPDQFPNTSNRSKDPYIAISKANSLLVLSKGLCEVLKINPSDHVQFCQDELSAKDWYIRKSATPVDSFKIKKKEAGRKYFSFGIQCSALCKMIKSSLDVPVDKRIQLPVSRTSIQDGWYGILTASIKKNNVMKEFSKV